MINTLETNRTSRINQSITSRKQEKQNRSQQKSCKKPSLSHYVYFYSEIYILKFEMFLIKTLSRDHVR